MKRTANLLWIAAAIAIGAFVLPGKSMAQVAGGTYPTKVLPAEDVRGTKHNFFNNKDVAYGQDKTTEVCVFCHTPHGGRPSSLSAAVPLWNRAMPPASTTYQMYDSPNFDGKGSQNGRPQGVSLACLSCHDGTIGIDSLINAPGSGGFLAVNKDNDLNASLGQSLGLNGGVATLGTDANGSMSEVIRPTCNPAGGVPCFQAPTLDPQSAAEFFVGFPVNFTGTYGMAPFPNLTTDLRDDHPISMQIPNGTLGTNVDPQFTLVANNFTTGAMPSGITRLSKTGTFNQDVRDQIRAYPTVASGQFVECASCHNPHTPRPLFLRLPNVSDPTGAAIALPTGGGNTAWSAVTGNTLHTQYVSNNPNFQSAICLSCHEK